MPGHRAARERGSLARIGRMADVPEDIQVTNRRVIEGFRANDGVLGPPFSGGRMMLLTTTGAHTGRPHTTPLMFVPVQDRLMVIASNVGAPTDPDWYRNLDARPVATVELGTETFEATAATVGGDERAALWASLVEGFPFFAGHQARTEREIPLVLLTRRPAGDQVDVDRI